MFRQFCTVSTHLPGWASVVVALAIMGLMLYPFEVYGKAPYRIEHQQSSGNVTSGQSQDLSTRMLEREYQAAKRAEAKAQFERNRAYIPTSPLQEPTRQHQINRAESQLNNAKSRLKTIDYQLYLNKRLHESEERDKKINAQ